MALKDIFLAYDIRGTVGEDLNKDSVKNIAKAYADWLPGEGVIAVGYDVRPDSKEFAEYFAEGLIEQGRDVWNIGEVATDMLYFAVGKHELAGGAMITASHNPPEYNGIKLVRDKANGVGLESGLSEIRDNVLSETFKTSDNRGSTEQKDVMSDWVDHVMSFINVDSIKPFKIAIDTGNGSAGIVMPHIDAKMPYDVTPMFYEPDGSFPNHTANPIDPANMEELMATVRDGDYDLGMAFDADGDRLSLVDENGKPVGGTIMTALMAEYFLKRDPGSAIVYNAICGRIVPETIEANGGTGIRSVVGHSYIKKLMQDNNAIFGGEHSMHYYFRDNWSADSGLIAGMVALAALSESGLKLSEYAAQYDTYHQIIETNFKVDDKQAVIDLVAQKFDDGEQDRLDGLTVSYDYGWFNVRPSNTEPLLRLNAEADTPEALQELVERVKTAADLS